MAGRDDIRSGDDVRWDQMTIPRTLRRAAERFGAALALDDEGRRFSFTELAAAGETVHRIGRIVPRQAGMAGTVVVGTESWAG